MKNDQVFDDASGQYLWLDVVLGAYLASLEPVVADFAEAIKGKR
jgi:hypothetical protein